MGIHSMLRLCLPPGWTLQRRIKPVLQPEGPHSLMRDRTRKQPWCRRISLIRRYIQVFWEIGAGIQRRGSIWAGKTFKDGRIQVGRVWGEDIVSSSSRLTVWCVQSGLHGDPCVTRAGYVRSRSRWGLKGMVGGWLIHPGWLFSCCLCIPRSTSACFTCILLTWLTFYLLGPPFHSHYWLF